MVLLRGAVRLVWQSAPTGALASIVLVVIQGVLPLASLYLMKLMVDAVATAVRSPHPDFHHVLWPVVGLGVVTLATALCSSSAALISETQGQAVADHVNSLIHAKSVAVDLDYYENPRYYDTLHRAQQEAPYRPMRIVNGLTHIGQSSLSLVALACCFRCTGPSPSFFWQPPSPVRSCA